MGGISGQKGPLLQCFAAVCFAAVNQCEKGASAGLTGRGKGHRK